MKPILFAFLVLSALFVYPGYGTAPSAKEPQDVRRAVLAGTWYPANRDSLSRLIEGYLSNAHADIPEGELQAIIVPHAGYPYSGQVAAYAYRLLQNIPFKRVVLIGPSHRVPFRGISVNLQAGYETPLGTVPVDRAFAEKIIQAGGHIRWLPQAHAREHCLEIQIPFLQTVLHDFQIVPILMGQQDFETCRSLAQNLIQLLGDAEGTLFLASTDLSHFHSYDQARTLDKAFIEHVRAFDPEALARAVAAGSCEACGAGAAVATMLAARKAGADRSAVLYYANSGDVTGDRRQVVGYVSAALLKSK
ncbi:MAG: AmmeMemoRadiSam system protein B [Deltaproteobacteria bacterium]|jgi:AmmeMemoRadiSam system protein B